MSASRFQFEKIQSKRNRRLGAAWPRSRVLRSTASNRRREGIQPGAVATGFSLAPDSPDILDHQEFAAGMPVWAWMTQDRWWPAIVLSSISGARADRVTIRLEHGVSVTVPLAFVVRREPALGDRDKPISGLGLAAVEAGLQLKH